MRKGHVEKLPVYFIKNIHNWVDITGSYGYIKFKCDNCNLKAMQDSGSLCFFVVEGETDYASLTCEEIQIKTLLE
jgi:hypothetical protein